MLDYGDVQLRELFHKKCIRSGMGIVVAVVLMLNILTYMVSVVRYYGDGMEPALKGGQILLINKMGDVSEGDIVAFYYNNKVLVRRVICEGGKTLSISQEGVVTVNGTVLEEPYVDRASIGQCDITFPYMVMRNHVFVMGDQREIAMDSRLKVIGVIPEDNIIGKVMFAW